MRRSLPADEGGEGLVHVLLPEEAVVGEVSSQDLSLAGVGLEVGRDLC